REALKSVLANEGVGTVYEFQNGSWFDQTMGRHYSKEPLAVMAVRKTSLTATCAALCGASQLMTPELQDLLDIHKVEGKCVAGASVGPSPPQEDFDSVRSANDFAKVVYSGLNSAGQLLHRMPALTAEQLNLLNQLAPSHKAIVRWYCSPPAIQGPEPDMMQH